MTKKTTIYKYSRLMKHEEILSIVKDHYPEALIADGFDKAIVGYTTNGNLVYNIEKMAGILMERDKMSHSDAIEYLEFNVLGAYVGEMTPVYIYTS